MNKWLKLGTLAAALAVVAVLALGASAFAQGPTPQTTPHASGPGYGMGLGMGRMGGGNWGGPQNSLVAVTAKVLGMSQTDLVAALNGGKTLADVAKEKGIATDKIVDEFLAPRVQALKSAMEAKRLTQAQADQWLATMKTNVNAQLSNKWTPRGPGLGMGFVDANNDGVCDVCGQTPGSAQNQFGGRGMRGRWTK